MLRSGASVQAVISWAAKKFAGGAVFVTYEQIKPHDEFGKMMMKNLAVCHLQFPAAVCSALIHWCWWCALLQARGCHLLGLERYPDLKSQQVCCHVNPVRVF